MSFKPAIPIGGLAGWRFLERTFSAQRTAFEKSPQLNRDIAYFRDKIAGISSAEALVKDRRLLQVALGAFGLEGDLDKRAFVRRVLEGGTEDSASFANRLNAPGYRKLAEAFGFGNVGGARTARPGFADPIVEAYKTRQFEVAIGAVDDSMRLAMNFRREIADLAAAAGNDDLKGWYSVLGSKPLRQVIETAFGLPKEFGRIDIDQQRDTLRDRTRTAFGAGSLAVFRDPANVEKLIARFLARSQIEPGAVAGPAAPALRLLQGAGGSSGLLNLLAARR